ncbi:hypothetical protein IPA_03430 [Ignicoccus pacificus DSM 13166]|uniref:Uncharacterized protein n=1 Tax=Ignicoccus pacificus DSM 13166 TaxID=940294 RepID=A0A977KB01_9CREN|nr:hypothetical protein IPA_03430 [Ignicoccus pacificus DSM 13166]
MDVHYIIFALSGVALITSILLYLFNRTKETAIIMGGMILASLGVFSWTWATHLWMHLGVPKQDVMIYNHLGYLLLALGLLAFMYSIYSVTGNKKLFEAVVGFFILALIFKYGGLAIGNREISKLSHIVYGIPTFLIALYSAYEIYKEAKDVPGTIMALAFAFFALTFTAHHFLTPFNALLLDSIALILVSASAIVAVKVLSSA